MTRLPFVLLAVSCLLSSCGKDEPAAPPKTSGAYAKTESRPGTEPPPPLRYVDVTRNSGIAFRHETGARGKKLLPETMGSGCGFIDYDGDHDPDLLLLNGDRWPGDPSTEPRPTSRLFRNDGGFKFKDVTEEVGLASPFYALGMTAADIDADGDQDLFIAGVGGYRLFRNEGGKFTDVTGSSGLDPGTWKDSQGREHGAFATSAAFFDYDRDGRPDLFVCHYVRWSIETDIWSTIDGKTKSYAIPTQYQGESCRLWRNVGGGRFEDATDKAGVRNDEGKSLGVCILDFDDDGWPDVAVANDTQPNYLYRNTRDGKFAEIGLRAGIAYGPDGRARAGMGIDSGAVSDDGRTALAIGNFSGEPLSLFERLPGESDIFVNRADVYGVAAVTHQPLTFGVMFLDADLDGRDDLVLANGHIEPTIQSVHRETPYAQSMQLLRNCSGICFQDVSASIGPDFTAPRVARGLAAADIDGDGDLDLCVTTNGGEPVLLRCDLEPRSSLRVRLVGKPPATDALGARVAVTAGSRTTVRWVRTGGSYLSQSELTLTFGLGVQTSASKVFVRWPDGSDKTIDGPVRAGQVLTVEQ